MVLKRKKYSMPAYIKDALLSSRTLDRYLERPAYQQNDYIGWITRAKRDETKKKRLDQMLDELKRGDVYMKMDWSPGRKGSV